MENNSASPVCFISLSTPFLPASWKEAGVSGMSIRFAAAARAETHCESCKAVRALWTQTRAEEHAALG